jgi:hypothetical protein
MISNTVVYRLDETISEMCNEFRVGYSRYADDLTFSADHVQPLITIRAELPRLLKQLPYPILQVNHEKTALVTRKHRRTVTGLVLANDGKVSLGHERKRKLRAAVHAFARGALNDAAIEILRGQLAYCISVEPDFFSRLQRKYGDNILKGIMKRSFVRKPTPYR